MSVPGSAESGPSPTLFSSLRSFWSVLLSILSTRLDLLTAELEDEARRAVQLIVVSLAGLLCAGMAVFFLMFFLIASFWDTPYRLLILGLVFGAHVVATLILFVVARRMVLNRPRFLSQTLTELHRDVESLRPAPKADEVKKP